jgi:hypothetical protein
LFATIYEDNWWFGELLRVKVIRSPRVTAQYLVIIVRKNLLATLRNSTYSPNIIFLKCSEEGQVGG